MERRSGFENAKTRFNPSEAIIHTSFLVSPGFAMTGVFDPDWSSTIALQCSSHRVKLRNSPHSDGQGVALAGAVDLLYDAMRDLVSRTRPDVLLCAIPDEFSVFERDDDEEIRDEIPHQNERFEHLVDFRSYLKAKAMQLGIPIQLVLPATYGGKQRDK
jgi:hypothetical protein